MSQQQVIDIMREALFLVIKCSAPLLLVSLIVGLIISILFLNKEGENAGN